MPNLDRSPVNSQSQSRLEAFYKNTATVGTEVTSSNKRPRQSSSTSTEDTMSQDEILREILTTVRRLDTTVNDLATKIDGLETGLSFANSEISALKSTQNILKNENSALSAKMSAMEGKMDELEIALQSEAELRDENEANSRLFNLEISGIPKMEGETRANCKENCVKVMQLIGSESGAEAIDVAHRKMQGGMIVKFKSRSQRDEVYFKRFNLVGKTSKDLGFVQPENGNDIYINESLTFKRSKLMKDIRDRLKIVNVGKSKVDRAKVKTASGRILVENRAGNYRKVSSILDFNSMYPLDNY